MPLGPLREVAIAFGEGFARQLAAAPAGEWTGPLESSYGLHLVLVRERVAAEEPSLATLRPLVTRELLAERQKKELQTLYERLLAKYTVTIEMPKAEPAPGAAGAAGAR
jgi:parvulin-like peptidyl-prolyl isomerase